MPTLSDPPPSIGKYLVINRLLPGDLVLSYGGGKQSKWIASSTNGPFSHAAIVRNYMQRVEALDDGVGLTNHRIDRVEWQADGTYALLMRLTEHPTVVLRHERAVTGTPGEAERFDRDLYRLQGLPYADWPKLLDALPDGHFARPLVDLLQKGEKTCELLEGRFCSECVAETYHTMGWDLPGITVNRVSPNDLWRLRQPVGPLAVRSDLIVDADDRALQQRGATWDGAIVELQQQFPEGRFGLDQMKRFKLDMATLASRQQAAGQMLESVVLDQIEMRRGTDRAGEIPALEANLAKLRDTLKRGEASARALGMS